MRSRSRTAIAVVPAIVAGFLLAGCSTDSGPSPEYTLVPPQPSQSAPTLPAPDASAVDTPTDAPSDSSVDSDATEVENPENRNIVLVPADQTDTTVAVGDMIQLEVTDDGNWMGGASGSAIESEDVFIEDTMDSNPYWGMYRAVEPGTATITITTSDNEGNETGTYTYTITVE